MIRGTLCNLCIWGHCTREAHGSFKLRNLSTLLFCSLPSPVSLLFILSSSAHNCESNEILTSHTVPPRAQRILVTYRCVPAFNCIAAFAYIDLLTWYTNSRPSVVHAFALLRYMRCVSPSRISPGGQERHLGYSEKSIYSLILYS